MKAMVVRQPDQPLVAISRGSDKEEFAHWGSRAT